jgi:hypothetical protein
MMQLIIHIWQITKTRVLKATLKKYVRRGVLNY